MCVFVRSANTPILDCLGVSRVCNPKSHIFATGIASSAMFIQYTYCYPSIGLSTIVSLIPIVIAIDLWICCFYLMFFIRINLTQIFPFLHLIHKRIRTIGI